MIGKALPYLKKIMLACIIIFFLAGCASSTTQHSEPQDPLEKINRVTFAFNDKFDIYLLKPCSKLYNKIIPRPLNTGLDNIFDNISIFAAIVNDILQFNFYQTTSDFWRLSINSTAGFGGFFDVASSMGLEKNREDFGLTLAEWGYTNSIYLIIPFLGPKTVRDTLSLPVDYLISPYSGVESIAFRNSALVFLTLDKRARLLRFQSVYETMALDPYIFMRNAYLQNRAYRIKRNKQLNNPYSTEEVKTSEEDYYLDK